jgi:hypothetical protein
VAPADAYLTDRIGAPVGQLHAGQFHHLRGERLGLAKTATDSPLSVRRGELLGEVVVEWAADRSSRSSRRETVVPRGTLSAYSTAAKEPSRAVQQMHDEQVATAPPTQQARAHNRRRSESRTGPHRAPPYCGVTTKVTVSV